MITVVHGGQTGVDRGTHEGALANGWLIAGYMPRDARDELGKIPAAVARFLIPHDKPGFMARSEANVQTVAAALFIVRDMSSPRTSPGTARTIDLANVRRLPLLIVDPNTEARQIAHWIWHALLTFNTLPLPFEAHPSDPHPPRLLIAGPRESKWPGAQVETVALLHRIARDLAKIPGQGRGGRSAAEKLKT